MMKLFASTECDGAEGSGQLKSKSLLSYYFICSAGVIVIPDHAGNETTGWITIP